MKKKLTKKERKEIYNKYNGHCAYCGRAINFNNFHVDHLKSVREIGGTMDNPENDTINNMMPSCITCNIRKGSGTLEYFRKEMESSVDRLRKYSSAFRFAELYSQVKVTPKDIVFFFELFKNN